MLKKYIRNIVKNEIKGIKVKITLEQSQSKAYWEEHFKAQLKHTEALVKGRDKEIFRLKEIIENLEGKLISKANLLSEQKEENLKIKELYSKEKLEKNKLLFSGYGERYEKDGLLKQISEQYEENEKLQSKVDEYYNKFLSEGIKKEKAQELIRSIEKEIDLEGFYHDDYFTPERIYFRIKNIIKES